MTYNSSYIFTKLCNRRAANAYFERRTVVKPNLRGPDSKRQLVEKQAQIDTLLLSKLPAFPGHTALLPNLLAAVEDGYFVGCR